MTPTRSRRWPVAALAAAVAFGLGGRESPDRVDPGRHVVLVVVDTLRADHVGVSGRPLRDATPNLDRLARRGAWFVDAHSAAPWTPPSVRSILTGLDPAVHGLDRDASEYAREVPGLPEGVRTLAQLLGRAGWRTAAVTGGGGVDRLYGFDRGFDSWYQPERVTGVDVEGGVDRALAWLDGLGPADRALLFLHTFEVHLPNTHHLFAAEESGDDRARASAAYDGDLAFADRELGRFLEGLEGRGLLGKSLVVLTADHGENLFERDVPGHGVEHGHHLHGELTHVPLFFTAPGLVPARGAVAGTVSLLDVVPTILSLVGVEPPRYPLQGRDLRPLLQGLVPPDPDRAVFAGAPLQGHGWRSVRTSRAMLYVAPPVQGPEWWHAVGLPPEASYDLLRNPGEVDGDASPPPAEGARLRRRLEDRRRENARLGALVGEGSPGPGVAALRALGYLR